MKTKKARKPRKHDAAIKQLREWALAAEKARDYEQSSIVRASLALDAAAYSLAADRLNAIPE